MNKSKQLIFLGSAFLLLILASFYKYLEFKFIDDAARLYNRTWLEELRLVETNNNLSNKQALSARAFFSASSSADINQSYAELVSNLGRKIENNKDYIEKIKSNSKEYSKLEKNYWFLVGIKPNKIREIIDKQRNYYSLESKGGEDGLLASFFWKNLVEAMYDMSKLNDFDKKITSNSKTNSLKYFGDIATLAKYSENGFKFSHEDALSSRYPDEYSILNKYKNFFVSYYELIKAYNAGQAETESYKDRYNKRTQNRSNLNVDFAGFFKGSTEAIQNLIKEDATIITGLLDKIYSFEASKVRYPFLGSPAHFSSSAVHCQLYDYKAISLYPAVVSKAPEAKDFKALLVELSNISPKTDKIDSKLSSKYIEFSNTKNSIKFVCIDVLTGQRLVYEQPK